ncbi:hypothetical protein FNF28_03608 [Cafeteria roenbergensis]|uniref:Phosphatidylinositol-3-phosphatase n=1 Tax=Cafeteria roenbergensis TaxID=33653 RepID=A0A5A8DHV7_CAFRO|nr:hypothetical protein FNF28_03608 [Cafeteria roenbergensis]
MEPLLQGRLRKRGHIIPSWRFRTFVLEYDFLRGYVLNYYVADADRDSGQAPRGSISITKSTTIRVVSAIANGFVVAREGQPEYWLAAASDSQRRQWMAVIEHARQSSMARERDDRSARPAGDTVPSAASGAGAVDAGPGRQREAHSQQFNSEAAAAVAASVGKGTITIRILRASGLSLAPRGAPFVCVACGTHIARSRVGVGVPTDPAFNETITLPFARTNLFAVVDVADEDKGGRVIGRATVPLLRASPVARRFRLPLAQPTTSSSAGAAGMLPLASLEPGLFNVLADWPPAACETVEAAAQVLLRPFADARAGLFPGTLFLTNFRLVWVAATHSVPDPDDCGSEGDHLGSGDASDGSDAADSGDRDSDGPGSRLGGDTAASSAKRPPEAAELDRDEWSGGERRHLPAEEAAAAASSAASGAASGAAGGGPARPGPERGGGTARRARAMLRRGGTHSKAASTGQLAADTHARSPNGSDGGELRPPLSSPLAGLWGGPGDCDGLRVEVDQGVGHGAEQRVLSFAVPLRSLLAVSARNAAVNKGGDAPVPPLRALYDSITKGLVGKADDSRAPLARIDEHSPDPDSVLNDAAGGSQAAFSEPTRVRAISDAAGSEASGHRRQSSAESHQRVGSGVMGAIRRVMGAGRDAHRRQESGSTVGSSSAGDDEQLPAAWLDMEDDDSGSVLTGGGDVAAPPAGAPSAAGSRPARGSRVALGTALIVEDWAGGRSAGAAPTGAGPARSLLPPSSAPAGGAPSDPPLLATAVERRQHFETGRHRSRSSRRSSVMSHLRGIFTARHQPGPAAPDAALSEGTSASFAEAQLPVLGIVTTDARAPRFIILGAGVLPEHEALGLGPSDADAAPAPVVCELLRTRLAYQIIASRSSETAFAAQSATHVSSLLREGSREPGERAGEHDEDDLDNSPLPAEPPGGAPCGVRGAKVLVSPQIRSWLRDASRASAVAWQTMAGDSIADFRRQGVPAAFWRACRLNDAFGLSRSYPRAFVVPARADDIVVRAAALFRSKGRVPALTWYHPANGAAICRSSQPLTGAMGQRSTHDEQLLEHIRRASPCPADQLAIIDCRPVLSAQANMLKGGGFESMGYSRCSVLFCNIANIHAVRKSYNALARACRRPSAAIVPSVRALQERHFQRDTARTASRHIIARGGGAPPPTGPDRLSPAAASAAHWTPEFADSVAAATTLGQPLGLSAVLDDVGKRSPFMREVSESGWLSLASNILAASVRCVRLVDALGISVLVHCSDGWDRTAQVSSLAKLLMDPYYRTLDGFQTLIATDWLQFGHKFSERMGRLHCDSEEASPIFLQWLDCVFQVYRQFPERFEFTPLLLEEVFIVSQAGWGGAFLFDNESDRAAAGMQACSVPEWAMLRASASRFRNPQYLAPPPECLGPVSRAGKDPLRRWVRGLVLVPDFSEQALRIWPFFQQFDRNVYSAIESTQGAAAPTLSMINPQTGGMLV